MIRNHLHSQRIKTIKTITGSSMDFFVIYKCLQLARKKSSPLLPHPSLSLPSVCAQQFQTVLIFFPYVCLTRFSIVLIDTNHLCPKCGFSLVWHFNWLQIACEQNEGQPFFVAGLKVFRYSFSETIPMFFNRLKSNLSLPDRHKIFNSMDWLWIEVCQNAVLSKIDITITTIKKTLTSI